MGGDGGGNVIYIIALYYICVQVYIYTQFNFPPYIFYSSSLILLINFLEVIILLLTMNKV